MGRGLTTQNFVDPSDGWSGSYLECHQMPLGCVKWGLALVYILQRSLYRLCGDQRAQEAAGGPLRILLQLSRGKKMKAWIRMGEWKEKEFD